MRRLAAVLVCAGAAIAIAGTQYVHRGYVGVTDAGGTIRVIDRGLHLRAPWHRVTFYPVECREIAVKSSMTGARGRTDFDLTLYISVRRDSVPALHAAYRGRHIETLVVPLVGGFLESRGGAASFDHGPEAVALGKEIEALLDSTLSRHGITVMGAELRSYRAAGGPGEDPGSNLR
jgi:hypothetical protein